MRESLFRGKREDNGEWVQGCHHKRRILNQETGLLEFADDIQCNTEDESGLHSWSYLIDPETLGEYTGIVDKNGVKIFEGDVVVARIKEERAYAGFEWPKAAVMFDEGCFGLKFPKEVMPLRSFAPTVEFEVLGNIHDNPEFLGGDAD